MFSNSLLFNGDISNWDVSSVTYMSKMFKAAQAFNGDISKWDVSSVTNMNEMFKAATSFHGDPSKWDVSKVTDMDGMFAEAKSFKLKICGAAWVHAKASKGGMFAGSYGSISISTCTSTGGFSPQSKQKLVRAVKSCLKLSPEGDCF